MTSRVDPPPPGPPAQAALHRRISGDLADKIQSGAWPPGRRIPYEHELMVQYGCARATANRAVRALADAGLIVRRRRAGSFVASQPIQTAVLEIPELQAEVTRRGQVHAYAMLSRRRRPLNALDPDETALARSGEVLEIRGLHFANGRPFALEDRLISLAAAPEAAEVDFRVASPGGWLLGHVAWSEAEHRIGAAGATAPEAAHLAVEVGAACLALRRWTWRAGAGVTFVRQLFPADVFELVARFAPKSFRAPDQGR